MEIQKDVLVANKINFIIVFLILRVYWKGIGEAIFHIMSTIFIIVSSTYKVAVAKIEQVLEINYAKKDT